ncbi:MAG: hypothetical protein ACE14W_11335, partial [Candidatus Velamenicoccus archaeovorus]
MTEPAPPGVELPARQGTDPGRMLAAGWPRALIRGLVAFVVVALVGQAVAFATFLVSNAGSAATFAELGWFYFGWFHHVRLVVEL